MRFFYALLRAVAAILTPFRRGGAAKRHGPEAAPRDLYPMW